MPEKRKLAPVADKGRRRFLARTLSRAVVIMAAPSVLGSGFARAQAMAGCDYLRENWSQGVADRLAKRFNRLHHFLFHLTRNSWHNLSDERRREIMKAAPKWAPPRPSIERAIWDTRPRRTGNGRWSTANGSGEDFLYFHREMITQTNRWLADEGKQPLVSWSDQDRIPAPGDGCDDQERNIPPAWTVPNFNSLSKRLRQVKSDSFYWDRMAWWEQTYTDKAHLRTLTLGELDSRIESSVHNNMHLRWTGKVFDADTGSFIDGLRPEPDIGPGRWDDPRNDALIDEYSAHVNPLFWRLHKWVDNRINDWAEAHGGEVETYTTKDGFTWFRRGKWVDVDGPWVGAFHHEDHDDEQPLIREMETVVDIITQPDADLLARLRDATEIARAGSGAVTLRDLVLISGS